MIVLGAIACCAWQSTSTLSFCDKATVWLPHITPISWYCDRFQSDGVMTPILAGAILGSALWVVAWAVVLLTRRFGRPPRGVFLALATLLTLVLAAIAAHEPVVAIALGIPAGILILAEIFVVVASAHESSVNTLERDAYALAADLRELLNTPLLQHAETVAPGVVSIKDDLESMAAARAERAKVIVANYEHRFGARARHLARQLQTHNVPQTDVFFRVVREGPKDDHDVAQIALGLERLARQLREGANGQS
jgi:hypothetical protein